MKELYILLQKKERKLRPDIRRLNIRLYNYNYNTLVNSR